jgi:excisionase family DNA binding protein
MIVDGCDAQEGAASGGRFAALPALLSIDEVCALLGVHRNTLRRWRLRGFGPVGHAVGGSWIYREDEVMEWVRSNCRRRHRVREPRVEG